MPDRLQQLQSLHAKKPDDPLLTYSIALEHGKQGKHAEAVTWLDRTIIIDPTYAYAFYQKALMLHQLGHADQVTLAIDEGLKAARAKGDSHAASELEQLREDLG